MQSRKEWAEGTGLAAALLALLITYGLLVLDPWPHTTLNKFLAMFGRNNAAVWRAQIIWSAVALAIVGLALRAGRRSSQLACLLTAAIFAWIGIAYFAWLNPGMNLSWAWAAVFSLQAVLVLVAGRGPQRSGNHAAAGPAIAARCRIHRIRPHRVPGHRIARQAPAANRASLRNAFEEVSHESSEKSTCPGGLSVAGYCCNRRCRDGCVGRAMRDLGPARDLWSLPVSTHY